MATLLWILFGLGLICFLSVALVVGVVWAVVHRIRRSRTLLRTRAYFSVGPRGRVISLRLLLGESVDSGRAAISLAGRRGELPRLFRRIEREAASLDSQLRLMESETNATALAAELPAVGARVELVAEMIGGVRSFVSRSLGEPSEQALAELRIDVDRELAALHAGQAELLRFSGLEA